MRISHKAIAGWVAGLLACGGDDRGGSADAALRDAGLLDAAFTTMDAQVLDAALHDAATLPAHDAGADASCTQRNPQSGICEDRAVFDMCEAITSQDACFAAGCRAVHAQPYNAALNCFGASSFVGCDLFPDGCSTAFTYGTAQDGGLWQFSDSCQPQGFTGLLNPTDAGANSNCP